MYVFNFNSLTLNILNLLLSVFMNVFKYKISLLGLFRVKMQQGKK